MKPLLCLLTFAGFASAVRADVILSADLLPGNEVPPHVTPATGFISVDLHNDLITLGVTESFTDLSAPATAAHIHCCAPPGIAAAVALPLTGFPNVVSGTYSHTFDLNTDLTGITPAAFIAALETGDTYANIHDASFPAGEIRGQLTVVPEPGTLVLVGGCLLGISLLIRRCALHR